MNWLIAFASACREDLVNEKPVIAMDLVGVYANKRASSKMSVNPTFDSTAESALVVYHIYCASCESHLYISQSG